MKDPNFIEKSEHIKFLISENRIDRCTRKLIDYCREVSSLERKFVNEAVLIRSNYLDLMENQRKFGYSEEYSRIKRLIVDSILKLVDELVDYIDTQCLDDNNNHAVNTESNKDLNLKTRGNFNLSKFDNRKLFHDKRVEPGICECSDISLSYKSFTLDKISISLNQGKIIGLVGENGSGKSTLLYMIANFIKPDSGKITYPALNSESNRELRSKIGWIPQNISYSYRESISVEDDLRYFFACNGILKKENRQLVEEVIVRQGLNEFRKLPRKKLSTGYKLRLELAKLFGLRPLLIVLDEPLANLDVNAQALFLEDIQDLINSKAHPASAIVSSQHLHEVETISDEIIFLDKGKTIFQGNPSEIGSSSDSKSFEISYNSPPADDIIQIIKSLGQNITVSRYNSNIVVNFPIGITEAEFIQKLIDKQVLPTYYRNISNSTKRIFHSGIKKL